MRNNKANNTKNNRCNVGQSDEIENHAASNISSNSTFIILKRFYQQYVHKYRSRLLLAVVCMLLVAFTTAFNAWLIRPIFDEVFVLHQSMYLYILPSIIILNAIIKGAASFYETVLMRFIGQSVVTDVQLALYRHLIYADLTYLNENSSGNLISRFTNDINAIRQGSADILTVLAKEIVTLLALVGIMFYQSVELTLILLFAVPVIFWPMRVLTRHMRDVAKTMQKELGFFTVQLDETFQNIRIIKSYCREEYEANKAYNNIKRYLNSFKKAVKIEGILSPLMEMVGSISIAIVVIYGGNNVISGHTTPGAFVSFMTSLLLAYRPLKAITKLNTSIQEAIVASNKIFMMLDTKPSVYEDESLPNIKLKKYDIHFQDVSFSYKKDSTIIENLNIKIPHGATVALVGGSGSGKTTILNLLQRQYEFDSGCIKIGKHNIKNIRLSSLRDSIALVSQEVALFDDTILENIRYGNLDATDEQVKQAAKAAAVEDFIEELPNRYNTYIGQKGVKISGGQRQRIAIARAILKNAPILLLDEATSALDAISEQKVKQALDYLKKGRTTVVIAHRLSTIENADLIYFIQGGKVIEFGGHNTLLSKGGAYARLYQEYKCNVTV